MNLLGKIASSSIISVFIFFSPFNDSPCYAMNQLILTSNGQTSQSSYNVLRKSTQTFRPFPDLPIICAKLLTNIGLKKTTICLAKKSISAEKFNQPSTINRLNEATGNFYDVVLLSDQDNSLPNPAKSRLKKTIRRIKKHSRKLLDHMILDANNLNIDEKNSIIEDYRNLRKVDLKNPLAIKKAISATINRLSKHSILGFFTQGIDSYEKVLLKDDITIINALLREKGFTEQDNVFFNKNHLLEQRAKLGLGFLSDAADPQVNDPTYPYIKEKLSSESIPAKIIENPRNTQFIPDSIHTVKNIIDNYQFEKSKKNPLTTINKKINKLNQLRMNYNTNSEKLKFK